MIFELIGIIFELNVHKTIEKQKFGFAKVIKIRERINAPLSECKVYQELRRSIGVGTFSCKGESNGKCRGELGE